MIPPTIIFACAEPDTFVFLVPILCIAFALRILPSIGTRGIGNDPHLHLLIAKETNKRGKIPEKIEQYLGPNDNTNPSFLSIVLAPFLRIFSPSTLLKYFNPLLECLNIVLFYLVMSRFLSNTIGLYACIFYAFSPILVSNSATLIVRPLAILFYNLYFYSIWISYYESNILFFVLSILSLSFLLYTHRSSIQVCLASCIILSIFYLGTNLPLYFIISIILSITSNVIIHKGKYIKMVKDHSKFFFGYPTGPLNLKSFLANPILIGGFLFSIISLTNIIFKLNPLNVFVVVSPLGPFAWFCVLQFISVLLFYFLDLWGRYSTAYLPFLVIPSCVLTSMLINEWIIVPFNYYLFALIILASLFLCLRNINLTKKATIPRISEPLLSLFNLTKRENDARIICLPPEYCRPLAFYTGKKVLYAEGFASIHWFQENLDQFQNNIKKGNLEPARRVIRKFSITHIFIDTDRFQSHFIRDLPCKLLFKEKQYELYELQPLPML